MKEKSGKKESIKEEAKQEGRIDSVFAPSNPAPPMENLKIDWDEFIRFFNATLKQYGSNISPITFLTKGKKSRVQALVNQCKSRQLLDDAVIAMARSNFLNGRCPKYRFKASFFWLTESDDHFEKVLNGYYDNPPALELTPEEQRQLEQEAYRAQQEARRAEARRIEEEERERRRKQREEWARGAVTYEEYMKMKQQTHPPAPPWPLR